MYEGEERCIKSFGGKTKRKRPLRRPKHSWEDIKMYLQELKKGGKDWIDLAQDKDNWQTPV